MPFLSLVVFVPLVGAVLALLVPRHQERTIKILAIVFTAIPVLLVAWMLTQYDFGTAGIQFEERYSWVPSLGIGYTLGTDGISFPMLIVTALITLIATIASWNISRRVKDYFALLLLLETGMMGVFTALDYILFYLFFEVVLVPMYFLIGIWGGPRREYAAIKFFIYTLLGSVVMLIGIIALYLNSGEPRTFDMLTLAERGGLSFGLQWWLFLAFFIGFAIKVPVFPFHTWLPDAHVEAPTAISVILAGILLKMGTYGILRINLPTFPEAAQSLAPALAFLGVLSMIYGAFVAMWQKDLKKLVAYSSVSHMGYVILGIAALTPVAINGAIYQMVAHGLITGMLFLLVGMIYDRLHTRQISEMSGLYNTLPKIAVILAFASFASLGLPGLAGFIAEFFVFLGAYPVFQTHVIVGVITVVLTAGYMLWMVQRTLMGKERSQFAGTPDAYGWEVAYLVPLMILILLFGIYPATLMNIMNESVLNLVAKVGGI
ncbi:MAG: NADH-quinone oxidoreductase subunit M [Firmicutes bacterium]|nr:NADH-quinone oxidoreductase subunit M [Bacillota bacterium]